MSKRIAMVTSLDPKTWDERTRLLVEFMDFVPTLCDNKIQGKSPTGVIVDDIQYNHSRSLPLETVGDYLRFNKGGGK